MNEEGQKRLIIDSHLVVDSASFLNLSNLTVLQKKQVISIFKNILHILFLR